MKKILIITLLISLYPVLIFASKKVKVGAIIYGKPFYASLNGLKEGLKEYGYIENKNIVYFPENINGNLKKIKPILDKFKKLNVNFIFTTTTFVALKVKSLINNYKIPVIFNEVDDPVLSGVVKSLSKPGGYLTGVSHIAAKLIPKRL